MICFLISGNNVEKLISNFQNDFVLCFLFILLSFNYQIKNMLIVVKLVFKFLNIILTLKKIVTFIKFCFNNTSFVMDFFGNIRELFYPCFVMD